MKPDELCHPKLHGFPFRISRQPIHGPSSSSSQVSNDFTDTGTIDPLHELDADGNNDQRAKKGRYTFGQKWRQRMCDRRKEVTDTRRQQPGTDALPGLEAGASGGDQPRAEHRTEQYLAIDHWQRCNPHSQHEPIDAVVCRISQAHAHLAQRPNPPGSLPTRSP